MSIFKTDYRYLAADQIRARSMKWFTMRHLAWAIVFAASAITFALAVMEVGRG